MSQLRKRRTQPMHTLCWRTKLIARPLPNACRTLGNSPDSSRRRSGKVAFPPPRHDQQSRCRDVPNRLRKPLGLLPAQTPMQAQRQAMLAIQRGRRIRVRGSLGSSVEQPANICGNNMLTQKSATNDSSITHPTGITDKVLKPLQIVRAHHWAEAIIVVHRT